ncbi:MAG: LysR family transcriptional regulator [Clostridia bacterium]|jgi:DNA-binding transcriptional LysR family regulator|nr:LysR family transcriptional regulator [Clostridia bacterium]
MIYTNFDLNNIKIFMAVYENEGIVNASKKLYITQPAVTMAIKRLEQALNGKLFTRLPKGIKPTAEGAKFYEYCKNGLQQIKLGVENFSEYSALQTGSLNIGASTSIIKYVLMPKLKEFCKLYPNIKITFTEVISDRLQKYLNRGDIDIAFLEEPIKNDEIYEKKAICKVTNIFVASTNLKLDYLPLAELKNQKIATLKNNTSSRMLLQKLYLNNNINITPTYEMASFETLAQLCENSVAVGFAVKEFLVDELSLNKIKEIKTDIKPQQSTVYALLPKGSSYSFVCEKFLNFFNHYNI